MSQLWEMGKFFYHLSKDGDKKLSNFSAGMCVNFKVTFEKVNLSLSLSNLLDKANTSMLI